MEREILGLENLIMDLPQGCGTENGRHRGHWRQRAVTTSLQDRSLCMRYYVVLDACITDAQLRLFPLLPGNLIVEYQAIRNIDGGMWKTETYK